MASNPDSATLARRWFEEVWNQRRAETVDELLRPDSVCHTDGGDLVGPAPFLAFRAEILAALPDLHVAVEDVVADGDRVAVRWRATGTHTGPFAGKRATGQAVAFQGVTWIRCAGGKMVEGWDCFDRSGLIQRLTAGPS